MKYIRLHPYHIQLENIAYIEIVEKTGQSLGAASAEPLVRVYFIGRDEPLEIRDPDHLAEIGKHFG